MKNIHPTAIVSKTAIIGKNVLIGPYCIIGDNVEIGDKSVLDSHVVIEGFTKIGRSNHFFPSSVIGTSGQDLKYKGEPTKLLIGNNNVFREFVTINSSTTPEDHTSIGDNCYFMSYSHVAHNCQLSDNIVMANVATLGGHVIIDDNVIIGGLTAIHQFVKVGRYAFLGGASGIKKDVPPYTRGEGMPYKPSGLNSIGLRRKGFPESVIEKIRHIYKLFYNKGMNVSQALIEADKISNLTEEQNHFINFIRHSSRGICK